MVVLIGQKLWRVLLKKNDAFDYVVRVAKSMGYTDSMIKCFAHEIHEKISMMEDASKEELDNLIEDLF